MKVDFSKIIGHEAQKEYLTRVLAQNNLAHAYLFSGGQHLGKTTMAQLLAAAVVDLEPARLVQGHDVRVIKRLFDEKKGQLKANVTVEQIRELCQWLDLGAVSGSKKVAIIENAESMNQPAQNALLKTLEEPSVDALIILVATDVSRLLPTIVSRTTHIRFRRVARERLCDELRTRGLGREAAHEWAGVAAGRPGIALGLMEKDIQVQSSQEFQDAIQLLQGSLALQVRQVGKISKDLSVEEIMVRLRLWRQLIHDCLLYTIGCDHQVAYSDRKELCQLAQTKSPTAWTQVLQSLQEAEQALQNNINPLLALEQAMISQHAI